MLLTAQPLQCVRGVSPAGMATTTPARVLMLNHLQHLMLMCARSSQWPSKMSAVVMLQELNGVTMKLCNVSDQVPEQAVTKQRTSAK